MLMSIKYSDLFLWKIFICIWLFIVIVNIQKKYNVSFFVGYRTRNLLYSCIDTYYNFFLLYQVSHNDTYRLMYFFLLFLVAISLISQHITDILSNNGHGLKRRRSSTLISESADSHQLPSDHHHPYQVSSHYPM